jgi:16S rRNA (guanine527-N7)-methyltransferase
VNSLITTRAEARAFIASLPDVPRETLQRLEYFTHLLEQENSRQNLVAKGSLGETFWIRHLADSAQLLPLVPQMAMRWVDLGSGPGLPGMVIAILAERIEMTLVESRKLRCAFLRHAAAELGIADRIIVREQQVEAVSKQIFDVISARAFAPLPRLLDCARHLSGSGTIWLLPKGKNAVNELSALSQACQNMFHVEQSLTDAEARILVGNGVPPPL